MRSENLSNSHICTFGRTFRVAAVLLAGVLMLWAAPRAAQGADDDIDYVPPASGAPGHRLGGASRTESKGLPDVCVLAPKDTVGQTTREQPVLYWYLSGPFKGTIEIAITPMDPANPSHKQASIVDAVLKGPHEAGLHRFDLVKPGDEPPVKLKEGQQYEWAVVVLGQDRNGSVNPTATCRLQRVAEPEALHAKLKDGSGAQKASAYAKAGIWFDAIAALNDLIDAKTGDAEAANKLRATRRKMLAAQGLNEDEQGKIVDVATRASTAAGGDETKKP